jgi:predicted ABC-type ATPase
MPDLYIITGSNGAGKSTIGPEYLPLEIKEKCFVFDGDKLFMQHKKHLWEKGLRAHKEIRNIAIEFVRQQFEDLVDNAIQRRNDFVYEGHFTNENTWSIPVRFKSEGYSIHLIFLGLANKELSEQRVIDRSKEGGHYVDPDTIESNFFGNLLQLDRHFGIFHTIQIIDTSETKHEGLCFLQNGRIGSTISKSELPTWFKDNLTGITRLIIE